MRRATVLGAGVAGLCVAAELAARGCEVTVRDPSPTPGPHGCSWWAGGMLAPFCEGESAEELAKCFGDSAEILRHDSGVGMPPPSWWEETQAFPERVIGGNRWCTQFAGPFYYK